MGRPELSHNRAQDGLGPRDGSQGPPAGCRELGRVQKPKAAKLQTVANAGAIIQNASQEGITVERATGLAVRVDPSRSRSGGKPTATNHGPALAKHAR
jgi:hypothetical protein